MVNTHLSILFVPQPMCFFISKSICGKGLQLGVGCGTVPDSRDGQLL